MTKKIKQWGFTLIEVMLLVLVVAIISFYSFTAIRTKENIIVEQSTAVSFQQWLEAGLAYYVENNGVWPVDNNTLINAGFLPRVSECSRWSGSSSNSSCRNQAIFQIKSNTAEKMYFQVSLVLPNATVAKRIQGQLPNSYISGNTVIASIPQPIEGWLVAGGVVNGNDTIYLPDCPPGYEGHFLLTPQYYATGWESFGKSLACWIWSSPNTTSVRLGVQDSPSWSVVPYYNRVDTGDPNIASQAYFLTFCIANGLWKAQSWSYYSDAQCGGTWHNYNTSPDAQKC